MPDEKDWFEKQATRTNKDAKELPRWLRMLSEDNQSGGAEDKRKQPDEKSTKLAV
jgi:hypothetical protein